MTIFENMTKKKRPCEECTTATSEFGEKEKHPIIQSSNPIQLSHQFIIFNTYPINILLNPINSLLNPYWIPIGGLLVAYWWPIGGLLVAY